MAEKINTAEKGKVEAPARVQLPKKALSVEFFVGVFMIMGVCAFAYLAINIAQMRFISAGYYDIQAEFTNISGLQLGAPVEIAGVPIGTVKNIALKATSAMVTLEVKNSVQIRDDDIAAVRTKGIIGDKYIKISPGSSSQMVAAGQTLTDTESTVEFEEIIGKIVHNMNNK